MDAPRFTQAADRVPHALHLMIESFNALTLLLHDSPFLIPDRQLLLGIDLLLEAMQKLFSNCLGLSVEYWILTPSLSPQVWHLQAQVTSVYSIEKHTTCIFTECDPVIATGRSTGPLLNQVSSLAHLLHEINPGLQGLQYFIKRLLGLVPHWLRASPGGDFRLPLR